MDRTNCISVGIEILDKQFVRITVVVYEENAPAFIIPLGKGRFSLNIFKLSLIVELWFIR
jgi:hypothetical protein